MGYRGAAFCAIAAMPGAATDAATDRVRAMARLAADQNLCVAGHRGIPARSTWALRRTTYPVWSEAVADCDTNAANAAMYRRRKTSVAVIIISPSSDISPGVKWT